MAYFGGGGVQGQLHPSLRAYIDCFDSAPFPRVYPRGGGVWDQDPELMRDFRIIRDYKIQWESTQEQLQRHQSDGVPTQEGGGIDPESLLDQMLQERGLEGDGYF